MEARNLKPISEIKYPEIPSKFNNNNHSVIDIPNDSNIIRCSLVNGVMML